jgi:hypothetical protein
MQLKITNNGKQNYSKICLEKSVHYTRRNNDTPRSRATRYLNVSEDVNYSKQSFGELDPKEMKL